MVGTAGNGGGRYLKLENHVRNELEIMGRGLKGEHIMS